MNVSVEAEDTVLEDVAPEVDEAEEIAAGDTPEAEGDPETPEPEEDRYVVRVNGEEVEVGFDELLNSYSRQSDYTKKTQELAAQRQEVDAAIRLQEALSANPTQTLAALREAYGETDPDGDIDPIESELRDLRNWRVQMEEQSRLTAIQHDAEKAAAKSGLGIEAESLIAYAVENKIGDFNVAARLMKAEGAQQSKIELVERKTASKRDAAIVEGGSGRKGASPETSTAQTPREAYLQAMKEHGVS